ncbi:putative MFS family arabinose efflux permease [Sphingobium boeckii]|uniref:Putative MFS family arabinose efflux permease n=2 Tax=Sphingobium boeckii TaxID=1082345 RepID=A0A7W9EES3_9SPHN|nr:putative MFS family arabinose efflux permease [Sphingobium boeckii]
MKSPWTVILCAAAIVTLSMGVRQSFGLFMPQMGVALDISRSSFGLAVAIQNIAFGLAQPFVGALADKHGAGRVVAGGAILYVAGLIAASFAADALGIHISLGLMVGLAMAGCTFTVVLGAVGRVVPEDKRSMAFGVVTAGGSIGQFLVVPAAQAMLAIFGYRTSFILLAGLMALSILLAIGVAGRPEKASGLEPQQSAGEALKEALDRRSFWLLNAGFFVCGFHITFIATHFPAYLSDRGLGIGIGASALALIGLFNIFGSYAFGLAGDRLPKHRVLAGLYAARSAVIALFLILPLTPLTALAFASAMGFLWLGTVPLTSGLVSQIFGTRHLSLLGGVVFLSHQVGSFFGAWAAGYAYDMLGSYDAVWATSIILGLMAALINLPINDRPVARLRPAAA